MKARLCLEGQEEIIDLEEIESISGMEDGWFEIKTSSWKSAYQNLKIIKEEGNFYSIANSYFFSDTFVFREHPKFGSVWIKLNYDGKIEEIGIDIAKRMHTQTLSDIIKDKKCVKATNRQVNMLMSFGDEYFASFVKG